MTTYEQGYRDALKAAAEVCYFGHDHRGIQEAKGLAEKILDLPVPAVTPGEPHTETMDKDHQSEDNYQSFTRFLAVSILGSVVAMLLLASFLPK